MIFQPTATSKLLIKAVLPYIEKGKLLDLGCGSGVIATSFTDKCEVFASDIDPCAVEFLKYYFTKITGKCGSLFEPWIGEKFDFILDDVSGIAEDIAKVSPWFEGVPCDSGKDGTKLVKQVIEQAPNYLTEKGILFFPVISLSDETVILETAFKNFKLVKRIGREEFPLPKEMYKHLDLLKELKDEGLINYKERFGMVLFSTEIYMATQG